MTGPTQLELSKACEWCGEPLPAPTRNHGNPRRYCGQRCKNNDYYRRNGETIKAQKALLYATDPAYRNRIRIHRIAVEAHPEEKPCEVCGAPPPTIRHHDDDDRPEDIRFLCQSCHLKWHRSNPGRGGSDD